MTKRITPAHLRSLCGPSPETMRYIVLPITVGFILELADQMEADATERDALVAKVAELVSIAEALYPLVESDPQLCNHPVVERLSRFLLGKEANQ